MAKTLTIDGRKCLQHYFTNVHLYSHHALSDADKRRLLHTLGFDWRKPIVLRKDLIGEHAIQWLEDE